MNIRMILIVIGAFGQPQKDIGGTRDLKTNFNRSDYNIIYIS